MDYNNSFIYTQGNGTATGRYIANNGVHEYISQGVAHESDRRRADADYQRAAAAQALAKARAEIAARGLMVTVVQSFLRTTRRADQDARMPSAPTTKRSTFSTSAGSWSRAAKWRTPT